MFDACSFTFVVKKGIVELDIFQIIINIIQNREVEKFRNKTAH